MHDHHPARLLNFSKLTALPRDEEFVGGKLWKSFEKRLEHTVVVDRSARVVGSAPVVVAVAEAHACEGGAYEAGWIMMRTQHGCC
jgi:hypothetical protein